VATRFTLVTGIEVAVFVVTMRVGCAVTVRLTVNVAVSALLPLGVLVVKVMVPG